MRQLHIASFKNIILTILVNLSDADSILMIRVRIKFTYQLI